MIRYRTSNYGALIEKVEIVKETKFFVFIQNNQRYSKTSDWHCYFETFQEAKDHLIKKAEDDLSFNESKTLRLKEFLSKVQALEDIE
jgi:hypothetical protein